jgi:hypothetical protein
MRRTGPERRYSPRYPHILDLHAKEISRIDAAAAGSSAIRARIQNLSRGGLCILSSDPIPLQGVVLCEIHIPELPVSIPALMRVRWVQKRDGFEETQLAGLQFVY